MAAPTREAGEYLESRARNETKQRRLPSEWRRSLSRRDVGGQRHKGAAGANSSETRRSPVSTLGLARAWGKRSRTLAPSGFGVAVIPQALRRPAAQGPGGWMAEPSL